ncbi:hypothetical protein [Sandaracinus amylolyticus]|nr:hypothetical protein [Sandaracinus amylolyticus]UJR83001.1 Hypothetical protein I5071_50660 [Sandaracinus amylolyticus]
MRKNDARGSSGAPPAAPGGAGWFLVIIGALFVGAIVLGMLTR